MILYDLPEKRYLSLFLEECGPYYCENMNPVEFGPTCSFSSFPPTAHTPHTLGLDLILHDVEINLEIQY